MSPNAQKKIERGGREEKKKGKGTMFAITCRQDGDRSRNCAQEEGKKKGSSSDRNLSSQDGSAWIAGETKKEERRTGGKKEARDDNSARDHSGLIKCIPYRKTVTSSSTTVQVQN